MGDDHEALAVGGRELSRADLGAAIGRHEGIGLPGARVHATAVDRQGRVGHEGVDVRAVVVAAGEGQKESEAKMGTHDRTA